MFPRQSQADVGLRGLPTKRQLPGGGEMNYGYVNASEQDVKSELRHRLAAYLEVCEIMKSCKNLSLFIALKHFKDKIILK